MNVKLMIKSLIFFSLFIWLFTNLNNTNYAQETEKMACKIIRKITIEHCKRGSASCKKCAAVRADKICLLDICPEGHHARRVIEVEREGKKSWRAFDVLRSFADEEEARKYADENGISDIVISLEGE